MQVVFGRDAMLGFQHTADWTYIRNRKQKLIRQNNKRENAKRINHIYSPGDLVLIKSEQKLKYGTDSYLGPYTVVSVNDNGTVRVNEGTITDTYNIRNVTPYKSR